jgi:hypothetical protein
MSSMTRAEAMRKIESAIENHILDSESAELFNFQPYGFSNNTVNGILEEVIEKNPDLDPNGEFEAIQSILTFSPSQERVRKAAYKYLAQYDSEEDFIDECGCLDKINDYFSGAHLTEEEIRAAFRKD